MDKSIEVQGFKIKVFLDTNILCYLVDKTYDSLEYFIRRLSKIPIVELVSSEYVLLEFIGVRKQENYFQEALKKAKLSEKTISVASFLTYNKRYDVPNYPYKDIKQVISDNIKKEESIILKEYGITFSCPLNRNLLKPTHDICLISRISKEDSLVLCSALYEKDAQTINEKIIILTNDKDFHDWYAESSEEIQSILSGVVKENPQLDHIDQISWKGGGNISLRRNVYSIEEINDFTTKYIKNIFIEYYSDFYIGITCLCSPTTPDKCIGLKVAKICKNQIYAIIISKDLDFIYCTPHKIDMYHHNRSVGKEFIPQDGENKVSFMLNEPSPELLQKLKTPENLVFLHPDN